MLPLGRWVLAPLLLSLKCPVQGEWQKWAPGCTESVTLSPVSPSETLRDPSLRGSPRSGGAVEFAHVCACLQGWRRACPVSFVTLTACLPDLPSRPSSDQQRLWGGHLRDQHPACPSGHGLCHCPGGGHHSDKLRHPVQHLLHPGPSGALLLPGIR